MEQALSAIKKLNSDLCKFADKHGYVETIPDKTVDPKRGYTLLCTRTENGKILSTVPLSYHIQGSAMWCTSKAMVRCFSKINEWNREELFQAKMLKSGYDARVKYLRKHGYRLAMQIHDEIVFDFPFVENKGNAWRIKEMQRLMEASGDDINVPLKVAITYNPDNWSKGEELQ
jgi:DNA polymerase I-like protein with 3'-5' exonuclease and polymerase domains